MRKIKKPPSVYVFDSWNYYQTAWISTKNHRGDFGPCIKIEFQADMESKDLWLNHKDAQKLINRLQKQVKYLKSIKPSKKETKNV